MTAPTRQSTLLSVEDLDGDVLELRELESHPDQLQLVIEPQSGRHPVAVIFEPDTIATLADAFNAWLEGGKAT